MERCMKSCADCSLRMSTWMRSMKNFGASMARPCVPPDAQRALKKGSAQQASNEALGRSRGGLSTKIHILCDSRGHPLHAHLSPGQAHESTSLEALLEGCHVADEVLDVPLRPVALAGDKGYRAEWIDEYLLGRAIQPVIPSKSPEDRAARLVDFDRQRYRQRNIVERLIGWLKECRRILTRFEKRAANFLGMIKLAFIQRYLKTMC
jgi:transposase